MCRSIITTYWMDSPLFTDAGVIADICAHQGLICVCLGMWAALCRLVKDDNIELAGSRLSRYLLVKKHTHSSGDFPLNLPVTCRNRLSRVGIVTCRNRNV